MPKPLVPGVKKGFLDFCEKGRLAGYPITGVRMILADGAHHEVDSSEWAFYQASQFAIEDVYNVRVAPICLTVRQTNSTKCSLTKRESKEEDTNV